MSIVTSMVAVRSPAWRRWRRPPWTATSAETMASGPLVTSSASSNACWITSKPISSGVKDGELIATAGVHKIEPGQKVKPQQQAARP